MKLHSDFLFVLGLYETSVTSIAEPFVCQKCSKGYKHKRSLLRHINIECEQVGKFVCNYCCFKVFKQKSNFKKHMFIVHNKRLN